MSDTLDSRVKRLEEGMLAISSHVSRLDSDISEIRATLAHTATKADMERISAKIDQAVGGLLKDALNSVPGRQAAMWATVTAMVSVGMLLITILMHRP